MTRSWHAPEVQAASVVGEQCSMFVGNFLFGQWRCENDSAYHVVAGCVHEHVIEYDVCAEHAAVQDQMRCNQCTDSTQSHECLMACTVTERVS